MVKLSCKLTIVLEQLFKEIFNEICNHKEFLYPIFVTRKMTEIILWQDQIDTIVKRSADLLFCVNRWKASVNSLSTLSHIFRYLLASDLYSLYHIQEASFHEKKSFPLGQELNKNLATIPYAYFESEELVFHSKIDKIWPITIVKQNIWSELFKTIREVILTALQNNLEISDQEQKKKYSHILNNCLHTTIEQLDAFYLGLKVPLAIEKTKPHNQVLMNYSSAQPIPTELFQTFLNAVKSQSSPRVLGIGHDTGYYCFGSWFSGLSTTVTNSSCIKLANLKVTAEMIQKLAEKHVISPSNGQVNFSRFVVIQDELPALERYQSSEFHSYSGIILISTLKFLTNKEIPVFFRHILKLLRKNGYILIHELFPSKLNYRKTSNDRQIISFTSSDFEELYQKINLKILLRIRHYNIHTGVSWLLQNLSVKS